MLHYVLVYNLLSLELDGLEKILKNLFLVNIVVFYGYAPRLKK